MIGTRAIARFSGRLADRYGRAVPLFVSLSVAGVVALLGVGRPSLPSLCVLAVALGSMLGAAWVVPPTMVLDLADDPEVAVAGYRLSADVGLFVGTAGCGALIQAVGPRAAFAGIAVVLFAGAALVTTIGDTRRISPTSLLEAAS